MTDGAPEAIGYIGLGNMGGALAARLQLTYPLAVFDPNPTAQSALTDLGARPCASVAEVASLCDTILLCLPTSQQVRSVLSGPDGLAANARPGTLVIDQTSGDPLETRALAADLATMGLDLIDAPVSGGIAGAEAGTIAIMVGATEDQLDRARPPLSAISSNIFHAGSVGAGHTVKLLNNMVSCVQRLLSLEALTLADKNGVSPETARKIMAAGGARNAFLEQHVGANILSGTLTTPFALGLAHKDVRLACQLGIQSGVPMFIGNVGRELYQLCMNEAGAASSIDQIAVVMDRLAGTAVVGSMASPDASANSAAPTTSTPTGATTPL